MGQPIISPWVIYLMDVVDGVKAVCLIGAVITACTFCISLLDFFFWAVDEDKEKSKKLARILSVITFTLWILFILTPSKKAVIEMIVAKHITYENVNKVATELKRIEEAFLKYLDK